jgi:hypothetical protein
VNQPLFLAAGGKEQQKPKPHQEDYIYTRVRKANRQVGNSETGRLEIVKQAGWR